MSKVTPTKEQLECIEAAKQFDKVVIEARAGAAKTTTLSMIAKEVKEKTLYWAFNKSAQTDASSRFPAHVDCKTQHSTAYVDFGINLAHKLSRPKGAYVNVAGTGSEIARYFRIDAVPDIITAAGIGVLIKQTVQRFEQSSDETLTVEHLPYTDIKEVAEKGYPEIRNQVLNAAKQLWKDRINPNKPALATHDTYLKLFQLSKPQLGYKRILLDECQDTTECVLDIFLNQQNTKLVMVGDSRQNIYSWRGSINAMERVQGFKTKFLSQSFRYGDAIAKVAEDILKGKATIRGFDKITSKVGDDVVDKTKPYTILFRTNAVLILEAVDAIQRGEDVKIDIDVKDFVKMLQSAQALYENRLKDVKHERIVPYDSFDGLVEAGEEDGELKRVAGSIADGNGLRMVELLEFYTHPTNPHATYTTSHKSKGLEYDQVILADDFPSHYGKDRKWKGLPEGEENLLYVAATRAKFALNINNSVHEAIGYMKRNKNVAFKEMMVGLAADHGMPLETDYEYDDDEGVPF